jgi:hypothetical protein
MASLNIQYRHLFSVTYHNVLSVSWSCSGKESQLRIFDVSTQSPRFSQRLVAAPAECFLVDIVLAFGTITRCKPNSGRAMSH